MSQNVIKMIVYTMIICLEHIWKLSKQVYWNMQIQSWLNVLGQWLTWQATALKKKIAPELLTNIDMLLMRGKDIHGRIFHAIHQCAETNNKFIKKIW